MNEGYFGKVCCFIDGTQNRICRPDNSCPRGSAFRDLQRLFYDGYKHCHGLVFQAVMVRNECYVYTQRLFVSPSLRLSASPSFRLFVSPPLCIPISPSLRTVLPTLTSESNVHSPFLHSPFAITNHVTAIGAKRAGKKGSSSGGGSSWRCVCVCVCVCVVCVCEISRTSYSSPRAPSRKSDSSTPTRCHIRFPAPPTLPPVPPLENSTPLTPCLFSLLPLLTSNNRLSIFSARLRGDRTTSFSWPSAVLSRP